MHLEEEELHIDYFLNFKTLDINLKYLIINEDLFIISFFIFLFLIILLLFKTKNINNNIIIKKTSHLLINLVIISLLFTFDFENSCYNSEVINFFELFNEFIFVNFYKIFFVLGLILFYNYIIQFYNYEEILLLLFILIATKTILYSNNILLIILLLEIQTFSILTINLSNKQNLLKSEATLKYFIISSLASGLLLYSFSNIYSITGIVNLDELNIYCDFNIYQNKYLILQFILFFLAFLIKLGSFPFHNWMLDIYEGFSYKLLYIFNILQKPILFFLLFKIYYYFKLYLFFNNFLIIILIMNLLIGALGTLNQSNIKKFISYTSLVTNGFLIIILLNDILYFHMFFIFYIIIYNILNYLLFYMFILQKNDKIINNTRIKNIIQFYNIINLNNKKAWLFIFTLFSFLGLPPLLGFFSKFFIVYLLIYNNYIILSLIILLITVISAFYYIRIIKILTINEKKKYQIITKNLNIINYKIILSSNNNFIINNIIYLFFFFNFIIFIKLDYYIIYIYNNILNII